MEDFSTESSESGMVDGKWRQIDTMSSAAKVAKLCQEVRPSSSLPSVDGINENVALIEKDIEAIETRFDQRLHEHTLSVEPAAVTREQLLALEVNFD